MDFTLIFCIFLSSILLILTIILFIFLFLKRDKFPYANISPLWTLTLLCCVFIHQSLQLAIFIIYRKFGQVDMLYYISLTNSLFIHYIMIWPIVGRVYYIKLCIESNYSFLTKKVFPNYLQYENKLDFHHKIYSEHRNVYLTKLILLPMIVLFILLSTISLVKCTRCYLYAFNMFFRILVSECSEYIDKTTTLVLMILKNVIDSVEILIFITFLYQTFQYPIRKDHFKIKVELFTLFIIWIVFHGIYHGLLLFEFILFNMYLLYFINFFEGLSYIVLTSYLIIFRNSIASNSFDVMLHNYDLFMQNPICFNYFKKFIKNVAEYEYNFLFFYIDYHFYKKQFKSISIEENIDYAHVIFSEYFVVNDKLSRNSYSTNNERTSQYSLTNLSSPYTSKIQNRTSFFIDFPVDIMERVEEYAKNNFDCNIEQLEEVFDEAYLYVNNKLYNRYLTLFRNEEEYRKLEKLICYFDFDLVDHDIN